MILIFGNSHFCDFRFFRSASGILWRCCRPSTDEISRQTVYYAPKLYPRARYDLCWTRNRKFWIVRLRVYEITHLHTIDFCGDLHKIGAAHFCHRKIGKPNISSSIFFSDLSIGTTRASGHKPRSDQKCAEST